MPRAHHDEDPAPSHLAEARLDRGPVPRAFQDHVCSPRRLAFGLPGREHVEIRWIDHLARTERAGQLAPAFVRFHDGDVGDARGAQRRDAESADWARAEHHHAVPGRDVRAGDAVHGHRERLGQCGVAGEQSVREPQHSGRTRHDVLGKGAVRVLGGHGVPVLALRRLALEAAAARTTAGRRTADDQLAHRPLGDVGADGRDGAAPLVPGHHALGQAPAVAELVDVGPADPAGVDADDDLVGTGMRDRPLFDGHDAW